MDLQVKSGGSWRNISAVFAKAGGTWRTVQNVWVKVSGVWQQVYTAGGVVDPMTATLSDVESSTTATCSITFNTDGTITLVGNGSSGSPNWYSPTTTSIGSSYWIKAVLTSGSAWSGIANNTLYALSSARSMTWSRATIGTTSGNATITIYSDSGGTNLVGTCTLTAEATKE